MIGKPYPLPSSLALREKVVAKENMIAEENIFAGMGIDVEIKIIVVVVSVVCAQVYCWIEQVLVLEVQDLVGLGVADLVVSTLEKVS